MRRVRSFFELNVNHPERWNLPRRCTKCEWRSSPDDKMNIFDIFFPSMHCPKCQNKTEKVINKYCPRCKGKMSFLPHNLNQFLWKTRTCSQCKTEVDKWGRFMGHFPTQIQIETESLPLEKTNKCKINLGKIGNWWNLLFHAVIAFLIFAVIVRSSIIYEGELPSNITRNISVSSILLYLLIIHLWQSGIRPRKQ